MKVVDPDNGEILNMPENNNLQEVITYGKLFIEKYGIEMFNEITKKNKKENPFNSTIEEKTKSYYNEIIRESLENNLISDEDKAKIRVD